MDWTARVRRTFAHASHQPDDSVIEELAQHVGALYEAARADGCSHDDAERRVADHLERWRADAARLRHRSRRVPIVVPPPAASESRVTGIAQDIAYALRLIRRQPRHALLTILTMALGIGATTVLFSVTYGVLMKPLPWPNANRIVGLKETRGGSAPRFGEFTNATYLAWRGERSIGKPSTIEHIAAWSQRLVTLSGPGDPERIRITSATASLFPALGAQPLLGSFFEPEHEAALVVVLSERLWRQRFDADPAVLGQLIQLDGESYTVVGVLPDRLAYPDRQALAIIPFAIRPAAGNYLSLFSAVATLSPGVTAAQAAAEGTARGRLAADTGMTTSAIFGSDGPIAITAQPLREALTADVRRPLLMLLVAVGLLMLTATANVASLQLARTTGRTREIAIRAALGAGGARVTRQLLVQSLTLGVAGGIAGIALTFVLHRSLSTVLPADFPRVDGLGVDAVVLFFAFAVSVAAGIAFGLLPALRARGLNLVEALAEGGSAPVGAGLSSRTARARAFIMSGQVMVACMFLVGASLVGRSFLSMLNADRGYDLTDTLSARLSMPATIYRSAEERFALVDRALERIAGIPGVTAAAFTSESPLTSGGSTTAFDLRSPDGDGGIVRVQASPRIVSPRFFSTLRMHVIAGRAFSERDTESSEPVVIVNQSFARRYLGGSALGARLPAGAYGVQGREAIEWTVIGIVDDVRYVTTRESSQPELYYSYRQMAGRLPVGTVTLLARTRSSGDRGVAVALRTAVREADERLVADVVMPLEQRLLTTLARPRLYALLLGSFATFALVVASVGLFGLVSYSVSLRSREIAIRTALGARRTDILRLVLRQGIGVTLGGVAAGMLASAWLSEAVSAQLYGVSTHDTTTFVLVPMLLVAVAMLACLLPARRAATMDPQRILRGG